MSSAPLWEPNSASSGTGPVALTPCLHERISVSLKREALSTNTSKLYIKYVNNLMTACKVLFEILFSSFFLK